MKMGKEHDAVVKISPEFFWDLQKNVANEMVKLLVCSMWGDH